MCNKLDRVLLELNMDPEECYQNLTRVIEDVNVLINTYCDDTFAKAFGGMQNILVDPCKGTVAFGSGLHQWGFTLVFFSKLYAEKFGIKEEVMMRNLWGARFYNPKTKKFTNKNKSKKLKRGFVQFIMDPLYQVFDTVMTYVFFDPHSYSHRFNKINATFDREKKRISKKTGKEVLACFKLFKQLGIKLKKDEMDFRQKVLLKRAMQRWLPAAEALMEMLVIHLPSPAKAQTYRTELLYTGPQDDKYAKAMQACDPKGPLMMYVSKMVPTADAGRFYAFGRVYAGTIATGKKCRIMGPNYVPGKKTDLKVKPVQRTVIMMGRGVDQVSDVPCGNNCALVGVDAYILKTATLTDATSEDAHPIVSMKFSVSPVVRVAVETKKAGDLPKLVEALNRLRKSDPMVLISHTDSGEHVIAGAGELHLEICIKDLRDDYLKGNVPIIVTPPVVAFRETVTQESDRMCLSKSPNKHNRLYMKATPLDDDFCVAIDDGKVLPPGTGDKKKQARFLADNFGWDPKEALKIWSFAPETKGPNLLVDSTKAVQYLNEIKESVNAGFQWAAKEGPLCGEPMRGVRMNLYDVTLHADSIHRGMGQVMPPARRVMFASLMTAKPTLLEPTFLCEITVPVAASGGIYGCLTTRRGHVFAEVPRAGTPMTLIKAYLPVKESFGFTAALRGATGGQAFPQCVFDHWEPMAGNAVEKGMSHTVTLEVRKRKGLSEGIPALGRYLDKL